MTSFAATAAPAVADLQDAAIEISRVLRDAKVDAPLRPKALAAILIAVAAGKLEMEPRGALAGINAEVGSVLAASGLSEAVRRRLGAALRLAGSDFERLAPFVGRIAEVLAQANVAAATASGCDFLGIIYEAFLRYGYDNNALGIVFTPRHIARFCVDLIGVGASDRVIDIACGTGGFLVAAHEAAKADRVREEIARAGRTARREEPLADRRVSTIVGCDTNPTVWALATLNMLFREAGVATGSSEITLGSCFDPENRRAVHGRFTRAFLNPPFAQDAEPERDFIDATMDALAVGGRCAVVVKAGIFADEEHAAWRAEFVRRHSVLGVISLPEDVFYPTAAPTSILLAEAHVPQQADAPVLMARVWNDGFEKLKNQRVERRGSELPQVQRCFAASLAGEDFSSELAKTVHGASLQAGAEWSPQEWLHPSHTGADLEREQQEAVGAIFRAVAQMPALADAVLADFASAWQHLPPLPLGREAALSELFAVVNGRSAGEKRFADGEVPYVSSGGAANSIVRLVNSRAEEVFAAGGLTITAFGHAAVQPWPFVARGNGGSAVRVLLPRFRMGVAELAWFAAQVNAQAWRFFYARMAIKSRVERLVVSTPPRPLVVGGLSVAEKIWRWRETLWELSKI